MNYTNDVGSGYNDQRYRDTNRYNWNNRDVPSPRVSNNYDFDNPLLPHSGVPLTSDDFVDFTDRIINSTNTNDIRYDETENIWDLDPGSLTRSSAGVAFNGNNVSEIDFVPNTDRQYDLGKFNIAFDRSLNRSLNRTGEETKQSQRLDDLNKLNALAQGVASPTSAEEKNNANVTNMSISQILINTKDALFNLLDDILEQRFETETFTRDNRLFYIGITILFFAIILYLYLMMSSSDSNQDQTIKPTSQENVQKIYHIYQYPGNFTSGPMPNYLNPYVLNKY